MKQKLTAAFIAATSILLLSCSWFQSKKHEVPNPLIGRWRLDSVSGSDTTIAFILTSLALQDSAETEFNFKKDTVITISGASRDTSLYEWNEKEKQVVPADTSGGSMQFALVNDSNITLTTKDNTVMYLQRK